MPTLITYGGAVLFTNELGRIAYFAGSTPQTGWMECDGSLVSRTTYSNLFGVVGTAYGAGDGSTNFNLPDLRGEFIRSWSNGRGGVDTSRGLGTLQASDVDSHTHAGTTALPTHVNYSVYSVGGGDNFVFNSFSFTANTANTSKFNDYQHTHTFTSGNPSVDGDTETRGRNFALMACIKY